MEGILWKIIVILQIILGHNFISVEHMAVQKNVREGRKGVMSTFLATKVTADYIY